jgi:hypothetical protein
VRRRELERRVAYLERGIRLLRAEKERLDLAVERADLAVRVRLPRLDPGAGTGGGAFCTLPETDLVIAGSVRQAQTAYPGYQTIWTGTATATYLGGLTWHAECAGLYSLGFGTPQRLSLRFQADAASIPLAGSGGIAYAWADLRLKYAAATPGDPCAPDVATGGWRRLTAGHSVRSCSPLDLPLVGRSPGSPSSPGYNPYYGLLTVTQ